MSENLKTIRELADEFKVSKQAVRKRLTDEFRANYVETVYRNGVATLVVTVTGYMLLKQHFSSGNDSEKVGSNVGSNTGNVDTTSDIKQIRDNSYVFKILEQQLAVKDKQIENKDSQISQMQNLLDQQQRLALQDKKLLEEYKSEIKELKSLNMPKKGTEEDDVIQKENSVEYKKKIPQKQNKKWWQFGSRL
ncbi:DNA-binding protein [Leuconostoc mesenteroides]|uniref:DNA-binding protein n=1 Tax=Leuconostoc mesenteroides TaxID=1245 RepID=UPI00123AF014|nr:DNA-binding protein [Leuconostoc mesenteroides]KAA8346491.1 DNA-binding protein [Leuconostoc mesenteroides]